ncbi:sodium:proton antiporter [Clostridia bacterium]|nr:sodium:proton antiporter [Clostridia bacterium]
MIDNAYSYLFGTGLILLTTKVFGMLTRKLNMPQVVGALIAGLIFGPAVLDLVVKTDFISKTAELGVIVLLFAAGLGTNLKDLKKAGLSSFLGAMAGVGLSLLAGFGVGMLFTGGDPKTHVYRAVLIGTAISATSVSIAVEALRELGKLNTKVGSTILATALLDDIIGLVVLTVVMGLGGESEPVGFSVPGVSDSVLDIVMVFVKIVGFVIVAAVIYFLYPKFMNWYADRKNSKDLFRFHVFSLSLCFFMAYVAQVYFDISDIIGAFVAGLIVGNTKPGDTLQHRIEPLQYLLLTPMFFASVGLGVTKLNFTPHILLFTFTIIVVAIIAKIVGCGFGVRVGGFSTREAFQVGCGMVCRGEVAIIVANKASAAGVFSPDDITVLILMVIVTSIVSPFLIRLVFPKTAGGGDKPGDVVHAGETAT